MKPLSTGRSAVLVLAIMLLAAPESARASVVNFFIHGHEDDWAIFMSPFAYEAAQKGEPVVFIYATAGDAGNAAAYWGARESAATASQSVLAGMPLGWQSLWQCGQQSVNNHPVWRCGYKNFTAYFMRSPDGSRDGCGYEVHQHQSLKRLMNCTLCGLCPNPNQMSAVDGSTTYKSWPDFWLTMRAIILKEQQNSKATGVLINAPDYDTTLNPDDHPDHVAAGQAARCAGGGVAKNCGTVKLPKAPWKYRFFVGYSIMNREKNVTPLQFMNKTSMYMAYDRQMWDAWDGQQNCNTQHCESTLCGDYVRYSDWFYRLYFRVEPDDGKNLSYPDRE